MSPRDYGCCASALIGWPEFGFFLRLATLVDVRAEALACAGEIDDALDALAETTECLERAEELWIIPKFLRRKGELLMVRGASGAAAVAEDHFRQASTPRADRAPCRGSRAQPRALRACGTVKIGALRRSRCFSPCTIALRRPRHGPPERGESASRHPTVGRTQAQDWEAGSRPIAWPSAERQAELLPLSSTRQSLRRASLG
jgi:hypothetical protein